MSLETAVSLMTAGIDLVNYYDNIEHDEFNKNLNNKMIGYELKYEDNYDDIKLINTNKWKSTKDYLSLNIPLNRKKIEHKNVTTIYNKSFIKQDFIEKQLFFNHNCYLLGIQSHLQKIMNINFPSIIKCNLIFDKDHKFDFYFKERKNSYLGFYVGKDIKIFNDNQLHDVIRLTQLFIADKPKYINTINEWRYDYYIKLSIKYKVYYNSNVKGNYDKSYTKVKFGRLEINCSNPIKYLIN